MGEGEGEAGCSFGWQSKEEIMMEFQSWSHWLCKARRHVTMTAGTELRSVIPSIACESLKAATFSALVIVVSFVDPR